ncbi:MAG: cupredoxin domain-containing protein [Chthoniobacterales bacterium]
MKTSFLTIIALAIPLCAVHAEGPVQKAGEIAGDTVDTAKNVGRSVARGTKKAAQRVADAVTPEADARQINVTLTEHHIDMPTSLKPGKTAFIVKNTGKQKHSFGVQGNGIDEKFLTNVSPNETKVLHVTLKRGTYTAYCPVDDHQKKGMDVKFRVK